MMSRFLSFGIVITTGILSFIIIESSDRFFTGFAILGILMLWTAITVFIKWPFKLSVLNYISTPVLLWLSSFFVLAFSPQGYLHYIILTVALILSSVWLLTLNYTLHDKQWLVFRGNLLSYINSFTFFFLNSSFFASIIFLGVPFYYILAFLLIVTILLFFHVMLASHLTYRVSAPLAYVCSFLLVQLFVGLYFLPTSFWVNGAVMTIAFYLLTGISRCELTSILSRVLVRRYVIWGTFILFIIFIRAPFS